jgi:hypothetical protein
MTYLVLRVMTMVVLSVATMLVLRVMTNAGQAAGFRT